MGDPTVLDETASGTTPAASSSDTSRQGRGRMMMSARPSGTGRLVTLAAVVIGLVFAVPAAFVVVRTIALGAGFGDTASEIAAPLWRTIQLAVLVTAATMVVGTVLAWITVRTDVAFAGFWRVALVLPLVLPSFVGAGAFAAAIAPGGIVSDAMQAVGVTPPRRFRGLGASWLTLTAFTYPYVLLPVSARLASLRPSLTESATLLGLSSSQVFRRVVLPEIRPAVFGGGLLVFLYTLSEFGAVQLLGYDTLTRVIFATRQADRATSFAAATTLLVLAVAVVALERNLRGRSSADRGGAPVEARRLRLGWQRIPATIVCAVVVGVGLIVPVTSLVVWTRRGLREGRVEAGDLIDPAMNTATVSVIASIVTVLVVLPLAIATTRHPSRSTTVSAGAVLGGFAIPGLVIALALATITLNGPGLGVLYQSFALLIVGYVVHFGSQALASTEQAVRAVPDRIREQSRLLEPNPIRRVVTVDLAMMRTGLLAGGGLVLLAVAKELPATLLLAPTDFPTLATDIYGGFNEGLYAATGLASLTLIAVSAVLTWLLVLRTPGRPSR